MARVSPWLLGGCLEGSLLGEPELEHSMLPNSSSSTGGLLSPEIPLGFLLASAVLITSPLPVFLTWKSDPGGKELMGQRRLLSPGTRAPCQGEAGWS